MIVTSDDEEVTIPPKKWAAPVYYKWSFISNQCRSAFYLMYNVRNKKSSLEEKKFSLKRGSRRRPRPPPPPRRRRRHIKG